MKILFIGDVFGTVGRRVVVDHIGPLKEKHGVDLCIANGENVAGGIGITRNLFLKLRKYGVRVVTGGNHSFAHAATDPQLFADPNLLRPLNFPPGNPGPGTVVHRLDDGRCVGVINLQGRTFFPEATECPLRTGLAAAEQLSSETPILIVDFHAEATSEKVALAYHLDGKVSAVVGTHTHVQTADERILPGGTAYITDVGMTGPEDSIIGMKKDIVTRRFLLQRHFKLEPARGGPMINAVVIDIDDDTGKARSSSPPPSNRTSPTRSARSTAASRRSSTAATPSSGSWARYRISSATPAATATSGSRTASRRSPP